MQISLWNKKSLSKWAKTSAFTKIWAFLPGEKCGKSKLNLDLIFLMQVSLGKKKVWVNWPNIDFFLMGMHISCIFNCITPQWGIAWW